MTHENWSRATQQDRAAARSVLPDADLEKLYKYLSGHRLEHVWRLSLLGLRRAEVAGLEWSSIDWDSKTLTVLQNRTYSPDSGVTVGGTKTPTSARTLPLPGADFKVLERAYQNRPKGSTFLACQRNGKPYFPDSMTRWWKHLLEAAEIPHVRLHDARHTCATNLLARGTDPATVAAWLGHANAAVTLSIYAHSSPERLRGVADMFHGAPKAQDEDPDDDDGAAGVLIPA